MLDNEEKVIKKKSKPKSVKYVGKGDFLCGIPARDIPWAEWNAIDKKQRELAVQLGIYEVSK